MNTRDMQNLQRANARLTRLIANLDGGVLVEDETRHIVLVNQAFCDMFDIPASPEALIGTDCSGSAEASKSLFMDPDGFTTRIDTILQMRQQVSGEILHLADGRVFARDYVPVYDTETYIGHLWQYHDVSEAYQNQRRWQKLLRIEEINRETIRLFLQLEQIDEAINIALAMTGQLLDVSRVYVFRFRPHERILDNTHEWCAPGVRPEIENLQGLPFDDLFPSFFPMIAQHDLIAPYHISELPDDLRGILEPQDIQTVLWMPLYLDNRIEGFVGYDETRHARQWLPEEITMVRTITESYARALEREQARRMLIEARDEAVRTAHLRAQFVANMSHEIRTPMTGILGMLELLLETELDELQHEFASEAFTSSSRLLTIVNDILDFSKLEAGQIILEADPIDLTAIATEVKMTLVPQIKGKPLTIRVESDPELPHRVYGDATRIRQVLMNLAGNAVKFTQAGEVMIAVSVVQMDKTIVCVRFTVTDTGIGIAAEHIEHIFESFVQADGGTTRKYGGSGLGLAICKQLVALMGGTISVNSTLGVGSTFEFVLWLPIAQATRIEAAAHAYLKDMEVLIIDPNRTARYVLAQHVESWGCRVVQMNEPDELTTIAEQRDRPFDVLFQRAPLSPQNQTMISHFAQRVILITDSTMQTDDPTIPTVSWPLDQTRLYQLLTQTSPPAPTLTAPPTRVLPDPSTTQGRILLVDDYPINVTLVQHALADIPVQIDYVVNGQEALDQLAQTSYDLVLMDMQMPVMDGKEATWHIRQSAAAYRTVPILALTASVLREQQEQYLALGVDEVISKPFSVKHLREVVQRWLNASREPIPAPTPDDGAPGRGVPEC